VVREIVGHSDIEVTMTIYARVSLEENARHSASSEKP
jgi:integrase